MKDTCTIWVCQCCILMYANGECCHDSDTHDPFPLELLQGNEVTMGMLWGQHDKSCGAYPDGPRWDIECDCETMTFSWSSCEGCGSTLGGERHAMTLWFD